MKYKENRSTAAFFSLSPLRHEVLQPGAEELGGCCAVTAGEGMEAWCDWLRQQMRDRQS